MANKKNHWYVLVMAQGGPTFVTKVDHGNKTAHWNKDEPPLEMEMFWAKDLALGLMLNFTWALPVCMPIEMKDHMYDYTKGHFEWVKESPEDKKEKEGEKV